MLTQALSLELGDGGAGPEKGQRDPSFSSYLSGADELFVLSPPKQSCSGVTDDGEIDVFSADKYFNGGLDEEKPKTQSSRASSSSLRSASSRNSQSALLQRAVRNPAPNGGAKVRERGCLGSFRCRCVCSDKNAIAVDEYETFGNKVTAQTKRETYLTADNLPVKPRRSLEVFGPPVLARPNKHFSFQTERKLTTKNWEEDGLPFSKPAAIMISTVVADGAYGEYDSDASSDLFEIEDFTGKVNPFLSRNVSGSATPMSNYAPSEASIEWSVVTASAADFPITSDYEELKSGKNTANRKTGPTATNQKVTAAGDSKPRRLSSSFLSCNSQDSVKIVDHARATYEKMSDTKIRKSQDSPAQALRPQTEAKLTGSETSGNTRLGISSRTLAQSNSVHGSNMQALRPQTEAKLTGSETSGNIRLGISSRTLAQSNSLLGSNMLYLH